MEFKKRGMDMSTCQQLDIAGMQPHSREYLEYMVMRDRSAAEAEKYPGLKELESKYDAWSAEPMSGYGFPDECPGIQFTDKP